MYIQLHWKKWTIEIIIKLVNFESELHLLNLSLKSTWVGNIWTLRHYHTCIMVKTWPWSCNDDGMAAMFLGMIAITNHNWLHDHGMKTIVSLIFWYLRPSKLSPTPQVAMCWVIVFWMNNLIEYWFLYIEYNILIFCSIYITWKENRPLKANVFYAYLPIDVRYEGVRCLTVLKLKNFHRRTVVNLP